MNLVPTTVTTSAVADSGYTLWCCDCTGGSFTLSLDDAEAEGTVFYVKRIDTNLGAILTIDTTTSKTIDGASSITLDILSTLTGSNRVMVTKVGVNWLITGI